jgi:hypothetical protein
LAVQVVRLDVGKIRATGDVYAWEPGYVEKVREQMDDLQKIIGGMYEQFETQAPNIVYNALEPTFLKARDIYCPVDTGALRESAYLEIEPFRGQPRVEMGFARGGNPYYAILVHEHLEMPHRPPQRAKFLETAIDEDLPDIGARIAQGFEKFFNGGA